MAGRCAPVRGPWLLVGSDAAALRSMPTAPADSEGSWWQPALVEAEGAVLRGAVDLAALRRLRGGDGALLAGSTARALLLAPIAHALDHGKLLRLQLVAASSLRLQVQADASIRARPTARCCRRATPGGRCRASPATCSRPSPSTAACTACSRSPRPICRRPV
ncbi:MAG: hypothetical protein H6838_15535 [Planctomycetes bacterium]|nr:hypothetical protein [Planctomycetota bacterium]